MFVAATAAIVVAMALMLVRAISGPTVYDRVLSVNSFGTKTVLLLAVLGFLMGRPEFLDIALLYALINFVGTIAILKFFRYREIDGPMLDQDPLVVEEQDA
ncbi:MAG: monovalent cation/H+ antiporter complex subunit F [Pseudomonadota bacterium]